MRPLFSFSLLFLLFAGISLAAPETPVPVRAGHVNDYAGVMNADSRQKVESLCEALKEKTGTDMVIMTVNGTPGMDLREYTDFIFDKWNIGGDSNGMGALVLLSIVDKRVESKIGTGLERFIKPQEAEDLVDYAVIAYLTRGEFSEGMENGAATLSKEITNRYLGISGNAPSRGAGIFPYVLLIIALIIIVSILIRADYAALFAGIGGALVGFLFIRTLASVVALSLIGFAAGYANGIISRRKILPPK
ncbi:MAG TPA: TPM domain-containing protein [Candidatus Omnitrophota bacterium]|nr:TPM domain-containing protein [Candidatus Omnitrophota bacterium]